MVPSATPLQPSRPGSSTGRAGDAAPGSGSCDRTPQAPPGAQRSVGWCGGYAQPRQGCGQRGAPSSGRGSMRGMSTEHQHIDPDPAAMAAAPAVLTTAGWRGGVEQTLRRIVADRGIDFTPIPDTVAAALSELVDRVEQLTAGMDEQQRQWLPAALAAPAHPTQHASPPPQPPTAAHSR